MPSLDELLAQGDLKQVSSEASQRLKKNPQDGDALLALAKVALSEGDYPRVTTLLQQAAAKADKQAVLLVRAALAGNRQDWKKARELYQSLVAQEPARPGAVLGLGLSLFQLEQYEEARGAFERLVAQEPPNPMYHFELGRTYLALGQTRAAARQFVRCLRLNQLDDRAWYLLVNMLLNQGRQRRADNLLLIGLSLIPDSQVLRGISNGSGSGGGGEAPSAPPPPAAAPAKGAPVIGAPASKPRGLPMGRSSSASKAAPLPADIHSDAYHEALGQQITALIEHGQSREALKRVREAQEQGVRTLGFKLMEGWACETLVPPDVEGAMRVYQEAIEAFPRHWLPRNAMGQFLQQQGQRYAKETIQAFEEAVRCAPQEAEPRFNLAQAYYNGKQYAEGAAVAQRLVDEVKTIPPVIHGHASRLLERFKAKLGASKSPT